MNPAQLAGRIRNGGRVFGTLITSTSPRWPDAVAAIGLDFVFIDTEHIPIDRAQLSWMCKAYGAIGLPPIVRIPSPDPFQACMALDAGAAGIIAPYVETAAQVQALRGAVRFRPLKGGRLSRALEDPSSLEPRLADYLATRNKDTLLLINIESVPAIARLDELLAVPDVDGVLVGPHDLSCSLGIPEQYDDPRFESAVRGIFSTALARGMAAGVHAWFGVDRAVSWAEGGLNFIIHSADVLAMRDMLSAEVGELRKRLGEPRTGSQDSTNI